MLKKTLLLLSLSSVANCAEAFKLQFKQGNKCVGGKPDVVIKLGKKNRKRSTCKAKCENDLECKAAQFVSPKKCSLWYTSIEVSDSVNASISNILAPFSSHLCPTLFHIFCQNRWSLPRIIIHPAVVLKDLALSRLSQVAPPLPSRLPQLAPQRMPRITRFIKTASAKRITFRIKRYPNYRFFQIQVSVEMQYLQKLQSLSVEWKK